MSQRSTALFGISTVQQVSFHAAFRTLGNLDWLVNKLIFHPRGMFCYNNFNRNNFSLPSLPLNIFSNLQIDSHKNITYESQNSF